MSPARDDRRGGGRQDDDRQGGAGGGNQRGGGGRRNAQGRQRPERVHGGQQRSAQRPSERGRTSDPQRLAAYTVLRAVAAGAYANLELPRELRDKQIRGRDAAFTTELVYGAIRMHGLYDPVIAVAAGRPVSKIDANVLDTLRLGAHQLLGMRVPTHAAVDETVALARKVNGAGAAGFVNAVMRRISERDLDEWLSEVVPADGDLVARLSVEQSHPDWVVRALRAALLGHGAATPETVDAQLTALVTADNAAAKVSLVARPGLASVEELVESGAEASPLSPVGAVLPGGDPGAVTAVREGRAAVQDEGSQLLALALAAVPVEADGPEQWLDLCAGPGGKAGLLAALALQGEPTSPPTRSASTGASSCARRCGPRCSRQATSDGPSRSAPVTGARSGRTSPAATSACSSTRRAPVSVPCAVGPRPGGAVRPQTSPTSGRSSVSSSRRPSRRRPPVGSSRTPPAARTSPRPSSSCAT